MIVLLPWPHLTLAAHLILLKVSLQGRWIAGFFLLFFFLLMVSKLGGDSADLPQPGASAPEAAQEAQGPGRSSARYL